jgi:hypothetical protein
VVVHQFLGALRLALLDRPQQRAVLPDRFLDPAGPVELASAQQAQEAAQIVGGAVEPAVRRERLDLAVKRVVGAVVAVDIAAGGVLFERVVEAAQLLQVGRLGLARRLERAAPSSSAMIGNSSSASSSDSSVTRQPWRGTRSRAPRQPVP